jgi:hypothetical protein
MHTVRSAAAVCTHVDMKPDEMRLQVITMCWHTQCHRWPLDFRPLPSNGVLPSTKGAKVLHAALTNHNCRQAHGLTPKGFRSPPPPPPPPPRPCIVCLLTLWLPRTWLLAPRRGTPRFAMSSVVPGCVPAGIFSSTGPSTVVTFTCRSRLIQRVQKMTCSTHDRIVTR